MDPIQDLVTEFTSKLRGVIDQMTAERVQQLAAQLVGGSPARTPIPAPAKRGPGRPPKATNGASAPKRGKGGRAKRIDVEATAEKVLRYIADNEGSKKVQRGHIMSTFDLTEAQATNVVKHLGNRIGMKGKKRGAHYVTKGSAKPAADSKALAKANGKTSKTTKPRASKGVSRKAVAKMVAAQEKKSEAAAN